MSSRIDGCVCSIAACFSLRPNAGFADRLRVTTQKIWQSSIGAKSQLAPPAGLSLETC
jgi:hypothetical protein